MPLKLVPPRPGKTPNWGIRGTVKAGSKSRYIDTTSSVAKREIAEQIRARKENEILNELIHGVKPRHTFTEAAIEYASTLAPGSTQRLVIIGKERKSDGRVSPCLITDFGALMVDEIDQVAVDKVIERRFKFHSPGSVVRNLITPLSAVLNWGMRRKWCDEPHFQRPKNSRKKRKRWASEDELERLDAATTVHFRSLFLFLVLTGCRVSEALRIEWEDVDLSRRWLVFRNTKRNKEGEEDGEDRGVPIHPQLVIALANIPPQKGQTEQTGRVFLTPVRSPGKGQPYRDSDGESGGGQLKKVWGNTLLGAEVTNLHPHDLRHTCATRLLRAGVNDETRDEILGHSSTATGRIYAHVERPSLIEAIDRLPWIGGKSADGSSSREKEQDKSIR